MITARLWIVSQRRRRARSSSERSENVPIAATATTVEEPTTTKSTHKATVWEVLTPALTISPAAAITVGHVAE